MTFRLPLLPYSYGALAPAISAKTMKIHYEGHHANYVKALNKLTSGTKYANMGLDEVVTTSYKERDWPVFHNAGQHYNHCLYWKSLSPQEVLPTGRLGNALSHTFGSLTAFQKEFCGAAVSLFGSGWVWLALSPRGLHLVSTKDADTPLTKGWLPLIVMDVWEHAYYLDRTLHRQEYVEAVWPHMNWTTASKLFEKGS